MTGGQTQFAVDGLSLPVSLENGTGEDAVRETVSTYVDNHISITKILSCLVVDLPYHMYWYDKIGNIERSVTYSVSGTTATISVHYQIPYM